MNEEIKNKEGYIYVAEPMQLWNMLVETWNEKEELLERINKAIKIIEDDYYSLNTTDIDKIFVNNKLLQVRKILKGDSHE